MNTRSKGYRIQRKAIAWAKTHLHAEVIPLYQVSRWAQPQPADLLVCLPGDLATLVEVRSNAWRTMRDSTQRLANLPGLFHREIWRFTDGTTTPDRRRWNGEAWEMVR